jgi:Pentapeptide repeats (8 copies)
MGPIPKMLSLVLLVGCLDMAVASHMEGEPACEGPYKDRRPTPEELATVLRNHQAWRTSDGKPDDERRANLCRADLQGADLQGVDLQGANLQVAFLRGANLQKARLLEANLQVAPLTGADLREAGLQGADLQGADLRGADLQGARLWEADLREVGLTGANLQGASLHRANLAKAIYEPDPERLPALSGLIHPDNHLDQLIFQETPAALVTLREAFKKAGMRTQERQLTYAIEHTKQLKAWNPWWIDPRARDMRPWLEQLGGKGESLFSYVLFDLPSAYGMTPSRALATLGLLILVFSLVYMVAVVTARGRAGIWVTWPADRVYQEEGAKEATRVTTAFFFPRVQDWAAGRWWGVLLRGVCLPLIGLYFSFLSAFSLGWRELNVGTWIARVQSREYVLRATGWVRTVAGIQSLLSVYLLALWVLTYFGRPFE